LSRQDIPVIKARRFAIVRPIRILASRVPFANDAGVIAAACKYFDSNGCELSM
jgi:hypothetical protein